MKLFSGIQGFYGTLIKHARFPWNFEETFINTKKLCSNIHQFSWNFSPTLTKFHETLLQHPPNLMNFFFWIFLTIPSRTPSSPGQFCPPFSILCLGTGPPPPPPWSLGGGGTGRGQGGKTQPWPGGFFLKKIKKIYTYYCSFFYLFSYVGNSCRFLFKKSW